MRPISLFIEKGSKGMTVLRAPEPPNVACRIAIWTSAEVPFVRTLIRRHCVTITTRAEEKLDKPRVVLGDGTRSTVQRSVQFRYRRWDIARMMKELDLNKKCMKHGLQADDQNFSLTELPARIGTWVSKTMIRAVKAEASSTGALGEHNTLPTSR